MIEAKFTRSQAAVIVAALMQHQEQTRCLDRVLNNILEQDIYGPIVSQLDAGFEDPEVMHLVRAEIAREVEVAPSEIAAAMSSLTKDQGLEIADQYRTKPVTYREDLGENLEAYLGSKPAENQGENDGQTETSESPNDRETRETDTTRASHEHARNRLKSDLSEVVKAKCDQSGVPISRLSTDLFGNKKHLGMLMAPSNKCSAASLQEAIEKVKAYKASGTEPASTKALENAPPPAPSMSAVKQQNKPTGQRVLPAMPGKPPSSVTAIVMEPARMAQAILAIAQHEDDAKAADEVGLVLPSSRAIAVIRAECTEWVAEARGILEAILPPSEQRERRIALQEKIRIFAGQKGGERIVVLLDPVQSRGVEDDAE